MTSLTEEMTAMTATRTYVKQPLIIIMMIIIIIIIMIIIIIISFI